MGAGTKIQWTATILPDGGIVPGYTFNPWIGCAKVSPGCANCYAAVSTPVRVNGIEWGKGKPRQKTSESYWRQPLAWNRAAEKAGVRRKVFCASLADWLDDEVPIKWLVELLELIRATPYLDWLLLSKRPQNFFARLTLAAKHADNEGNTSLASWIYWWIDQKTPRPPENVWMGTTTENQEYADLRVPALLKIPAEKHFLSVEPMLGMVDLRRWMPCIHGDPLHCPNIPQTCCQCDSRRESNKGVDWVIYGGESGSGARPCGIDWIRNGVRQCREARVPVFVKQLGTNISTTMFADNWPNGTRTHNGLDVILDDKKGGEMAQWPEDLRVRQFPPGKGIA